MTCAHIYTDTPKNRERDRVGVRCGAAAVNETPFCKFHGGNSQQVIDKYRNERFEEAVRQERDAATGFTDLWPESHHLLDPFSLLLWDIRRAGSRIEWFDAQIARLEEEKSIWWGLTKSEEIGASEFAGTNKTYEARENVLVKMQNEERKRLKDLRDQWQDNRFSAAKIAGYGAFRASTTAAIRAIATEFELDLEDEAVQRRLRRALESLPEPIPMIEAPDHQEA